MSDKVFHNKLNKIKLLATPPKNAMSAYTIYGKEMRK